MITLQPLHQLLDQLHTPVQDMAQLGFCDGNRESSISAWARSLPLTQIQFVSGLLYQALPDISRYQTSASNRIHLLETLRRPTLQTIEGLAQHFLNQPLILPNNAVKAATIAQALQKHLISGYLVAIRDLCKDASPPKNLLALAIQRAIVGMGLLLLRYYQLYVPVSAQIWTELHSLYQIALHFSIEDTGLTDEQPHQQHCRTVKLSYMRVLLLACAHPNQLRQEEILAAYEALDSLTHLAQLESLDEKSNKENLFAVALNSNRPPQYRSRFKPHAQKLLLALNTSAICKKLEEVNANIVETSESTGWRNALQLTPALTFHLIRSWNFLALRNFERKETDGHLQVTVGLTNIHYHLAGGVNFTTFLNKIKTPISGGLNTIFQRREASFKTPQTNHSVDSAWENAFDVTGTPLAKMAVETSNIENLIRQQEDIDYKEPHPIHQVPLIDASAGGYCIEWRDEIPHQVKAGELLGLSDAIRNRWSLGVVRWANQTKGATQLGIQILAPTITPIGIAIIHKSGDASEYLRALEIPEMKAINQPATIITNAVSFHEYNKARVFYQSDTDENGTTTNIQLTRRLFATGSFSQFTFRDLTQNKPSEADRNDDFDSIWDS